MVELDSSSAQLFAITLWTKHSCNNNSKTMPNKAEYEIQRDQNPIKGRSSTTALDFILAYIDLERTDPVSSYYGMS